SRWLEHMLRHVVVVTLSGDLLNDHAEQQKSVVAVLPLGARLELQVSLAEEAHVVLQRLQLEPVGIEFRPEKIAGSSGVRQQMMNGHLRGHILIRIIRQELSNRIGQLDLARLHQLQRGYRSEHLVHRTDAKLCAQLVRYFPLAVGHSIREAKDLLSVFQNDSRPGKSISPCVL